MVALASGDGLLLAWLSSGTEAEGRPKRARRVPLLRARGPVQDGLDVSSRSGLAPRFRATANDGGWFPRLGVQQAPGHGCDQKAAKMTRKGRAPTCEAISAPMGTVSAPQEPTVAASRSLSVCVLWCISAPITQMGIKASSAVP